MFAYIWIKAQNRKDTHTYCGFLGLNTREDWVTLQVGTSTVEYYLHPQVKSLIFKSLVSIYQANDWSICLKRSIRKKLIVTKEISCLLRNPKDRYRVNNSPPLDLELQ
jgi:hypothetical protein